jgi:hypothetical protein
MRSTILTLCAIAFVCSGCLRPENFESPDYVASSQPSSKTYPLRVAVAYPDEGLSAPNRDEDIQPIISASCAQGHTYISPRLDISRGLIDELRATKAFEAAHWAPESLDDYDLVVRLKIVDGGERFKSDTCPMLLGPFKWELVVADQKGAELHRSVLTQAKVDLYARGVVQQYRKDEKVFLAQALQPILEAADKMAAAAPDARAARILAYVDKRAPELQAVREKLASGEDPALERSYLQQLAALESARIVEEKAIESHQALDDKAWIDLQEQSRQELKAYGENVRQMIRDNFLMLFSDIANAGVQVGMAHGKPEALLKARTDARGDLAKRFEAPDGVQGLLGALPKGLLPGKSKQLIADTAFGVDLANKLRKSLTASDSDQDAGAAGGQTGCDKDTDCKGDRICIDRVCTAPAGK